MAIEAPRLLTPEARNFLSAKPRYATLATINRDGSPHQIVIWFLLRDGDLVVNSRRGRRWPSNLERDGRANLAVYEAEDAVTMNCTLERVCEGDEAQADIAAMARRYDMPEVAEHEISRFVTEQRVTFIRYDMPEVAEHEISRFVTEQRVTFILRPTKVSIHGEPH